jgi:peptidoglycan/xylan/chitin deacetylase (PgdA/CDA1 family)
MVRRPLLALCALSGAALLALAGCGDSATPGATWHAARPAAAQGRSGTNPVDNTPGRPGSKHSPPAPSTSPSAPSTPPASPSTSPSVAGPAVENLRLGQLKTGSNAVALTFDDGPGPYTPQILALLRQYHVKATFCLIGVNVQKYHDYVQQIVADGHTLCNHSWKHDIHLGKKSVDAIRADLQATNDEIHRAVPDAKIAYFRAPGGNFTPQSVEVAKELGMKPLGWNVDPDDWDVKKYPEGPAMTGHIEGVLRKRIHRGSIVLSHDGGGHRECTVSAYKALLPDLTKRFTLIPMPA